MGQVTATSPTSLALANDGGATHLPTSRQAPRDLGEGHVICRWLAIAVQDKMWEGNPSKLKRVYELMAGMPTKLGLKLEHNKAEHVNFDKAHTHLAPDSIDLGHRPLHAG